MPLHHPLKNRAEGLHVCPGGCGEDVPVEDYVCLSCALRELHETSDRAEGAVIDFSGDVTISHPGKP